MILRCRCWRWALCGGQLIDDRLPLRSTGYWGLRQPSLLLVAGLVLVMAVVACSGGRRLTCADRAAIPGSEDGKLRIAHWQADFG